MPAKTIAITLDGTDRRVMNNGLNREWDHLQKIISDLGGKIAYEKDADERTTLLMRHEGFTIQQEAIEGLLRILFQI